MSTPKKKCIYCEIGLVWKYVALRQRSSTHILVLSPRRRGVSICTSTTFPCTIITAQYISKTCSTLLDKDARATSPAPFFRHIVLQKSQRSIEYFLKSMSWILQTSAVDRFHTRSGLIIIFTVTVYVTYLLKICKMEKCWKWASTLTFHISM